MQKMSRLYTKEMAKVNRGKSSARLRVGLVDLDASTTLTTLIGSAPESFSRIESAVYENGVPTRVYATLEPGRMRLDGSQIILPRENPTAQGYVSAALSGANCAYAAPPTVNITFSKTHRVAGLTFVFDKAAGDYPASFRIEAWRGTKLLLTENARPTAPAFVSGNKITNFDRLRFTWLTSNVPYRRARLQQIIFGIGLLIDGAKLISVDKTAEVDPLSRRLPVDGFSFVIDNFDGAYDPDNPNNHWELLELQSPIWLQYGQHITEGLLWGDSRHQRWEDAETRTWGAARFGGTTEVVDGGRYYLTAKPQCDADTAHFEGVTILGRMKEPFLKGRLQTSTLYALAEAVLLDADLPLLDAGQRPWKLWNGLKSITTSAPLPNKSGAECLQLIAHAACAVLFVDRDGYIRIEPISSVQNDLALDFATQSAQPTVEKTPTVRSVACKYYLYKTDGEETELFNSKFNVSGTASLFLAFSGASVVTSVTVVGAAEKHDTYVYGMRVYLTGNGEAAVIIKGKALVSAASSVYVDVPDADEHGSIETVTNPLLTNAAHARNVAHWVGAYLARRNAYSFAFRGDPALDPLDAVYTQSRYVAQFRATLLHCETHFDGTLSGNAVVKRLG